MTSSANSSKGGIIGKPKKKGAHPRKAVPGGPPRGTRPSTFSEKVCLEILDLIANHGHTVTSACRSQPHYPWPSTFRNWAEDREDLQNALEKAQQHLAYQLIDETLALGDSQDEEVARARFQVEKKTNFATTLLTKYANLKNKGQKAPAITNQTNVQVNEAAAVQEAPRLRIPVGTMSMEELKAWRALLALRRERVEQGLIEADEGEDNDDINE